VDALVLWWVRPGDWAAGGLDAVEAAFAEFEQNQVGGDHRCERGEEAGPVSA
jgi:hypothetical protein